MHQVRGARKQPHIENRTEKMGILVLAATVALFYTLAHSASQEANTTFPFTYRAIAAEGGEQGCSHDELRQRLQAIIYS